MGLAYWNQQCPHCKRSVGIQIAGLGSGLGPRHFVCRGCDGVYRSGRTEWVDMTPGQRYRYGIVSLVYAAALGFFGGATTNDAAQRWKNPKQNAFDIRPDLFWAGALSWAGLILAIQAVRVFRSVWRKDWPENESNPPGPGDDQGAGPAKPHRPSFWLQQGLTFLFMFLVFLPIFLSWLIASIRDRLERGG
jgi:hypothetical protein